MFENELREIRNNFIKEHNLKCENCQFWEKNRKGKCASKVYCIVKDNVLYCNYKPKENKPFEIHNSEAEQELNLYNNLLDVM